MRKSHLVGSVGDVVNVGSRKIQCEMNWCISVQGQATTFDTNAVETLTSNKALFYSEVQSYAVNW
jgi:hypothetical protein